MSEAVKKLVCRDTPQFCCGVVYFWRTKDKAVEVKYSNLKQPETTRSFKSFLEKYKPEKAFIVHLGEHMEDRFEDTKIFFIPFYKLPRFVSPRSSLTSLRLRSKACVLRTKAKLAS